MKTFHIITFGCQMNEHDSERMTGMLEAQGYSPAADADTADMVILNTCSIREKAEQKFYSELGRLRHVKVARPQMKLAVAGCIAQQEGGNMLSRAPYVDMIIGPSDIGKLPSLVDLTSSRTETVISTEGDTAYHRKRLPTTRKDRIKAWVSIMYGCDNFCTYCVVPYLRGRERSRPPEDIEIEIAELAANGFKEVTLLGQNVNSYGKGLDGDIDFPALLHRLHAVPGIERIRFVTSHPKDLSPRLIEAMRDLPKLCESLHLPIQSGADSMLTAMNRRYTRAHYLDKVAALRAAVPELALTTDIIVGFPGETEADFEQTIELLAQVRYDGIFAFKYSRRPGTAALKLDDHLSDDVKEARLDKVLSLQKDIALQKNSSYIGTVQEVLLDGHSRKGSTLTGRTRSNKVVNVAAPVELLGSVVRVSITSAGLNSLQGTLL